MHHPTDRIAHTTAFVIPVVEHWLEREIAQWVHSMKDRSDDPSHHERTLLPRSYISLSICVVLVRAVAYDYWTISHFHYYSYSPSDKHNKKGFPLTCWSLMGFELRRLHIAHAESSTKHTQQGRQFCSHKVMPQIIYILFVVLVLSKYE